MFGAIFPVREDKGILRDAFFHLRPGRSSHQEVSLHSLTYKPNNMKETRIVVKLHEVKIWRVRLRLLFLRLERKDTGTDNKNGRLVKSR